MFNQDHDRSSDPKGIGMKQQQVSEKKQDVHKKASQPSVKSKVSDRCSEHPPLQVQGIIANHVLISHFPQGRNGYKVVRFNHQFEESTVTKIRKHMDVGKKLDTNTRSEMEYFLGQRFNDVTVHEGNVASDLAGYFHANAFTLGPDIFFAPGKYDPHSSSGKRLIAHELTHVAQQRRNVDIKSHKRAYECEAQDNARAISQSNVLSNNSIATSLSYTLALQFDNRIDIVRDRRAMNLIFFIYLDEDAAADLADVIVAGGGVSSIAAALAGAGFIAAAPLLLAIAAGAAVVGGAGLRIMNRHGHGLVIQIGSVSGPAESVLIYPRNEFERLMRERPELFLPSALPVGITPRPVLIQPERFL